MTGRVAEDEAGVRLWTFFVKQFVLHPVGGGSYQNVFH